VNLWYCLKLSFLFYWRCWTLEQFISRNPFQSSTFVGQAFEPTLTLELPETVSQSLQYLPEPKACSDKALLIVNKRFATLTSVVLFGKWQRVDLLENFHFLENRDQLKNTFFPPKWDETYSTLCKGRARREGRRWRQFSTSASSFSILTTSPTTTTRWNGARVDTRIPNRWKLSPSDPCLHLEIFLIIFFCKYYFQGLYWCRNRASGWTFTQRKNKDYISCQPSKHLTCVKWGTT